MGVDRTIRDARVADLTQLYLTMLADPANLRSTLETGRQYRSRLGRRQG